MPCAPLENYDGPPDWTIESAPSQPCTAIEEAGDAATASATYDLERAYRDTLRENGVSSGEGASLFDHMRALGLLPQQ